MRGSQSITFTLKGGDSLVWDPTCTETLKRVRGMAPATSTVKLPYEVMFTALKTLFILQELVSITQALLGPVYWADASILGNDPSL